MKINKKTMVIGFVLGATLLIIWTKSLKLLLIFVPTLLFIWLVSSLVKEHQEEKKKK